MEQENLIIYGARCEALDGQLRIQFQLSKKRNKIICLTSVQKVPENLKMDEFLLYREDKCTVIQNQLSTNSYYEISSCH